MEGKKDNLEALRKALGRSKRVLILPHDNPDPDSISSSCTLRYLLAKAFAIKSRVAYRGVIGRAENKAMVKLLKLSIRPINRLNIKNFDGVILIDTQPKTGYNPLPRKVTPLAVIDHHPLRKTTKAAFTDVRKEIGATATIILEYLLQSGLEIPGNIATALFYGISSETQALGRESTREDMKAYITLFPKINKKLLSRIERPKLPKEYFSTLNHAIQTAKTYKNVIWASLGDIETPEFVAQVADFLLMHERITWSLCLGRYDERIWLSIRTTNIKARAERLIKRLIGARGTAGGHNMIAGGQIDCSGLPLEEYNEIEKNVIKKFLKLTVKNGEKEGKPLIK